jgi:hypothetical protein
MLLLFIIFTSCEKKESAGGMDSYLVKKEIRIDEGLDTIITTYKYENDRLIEENFADQTRFTYEYNDTSVLFKIEDTYDGRLFKVSRTIIKNDLATKLIGLWPEDGYGDLLPNGVTVIYHYDSDNHLIETEEYDDLVSISKTINTWDSNGDLIKTESFDSKDPGSPVITYQYSYYSDKIDVREYGLSYQGKNSKHLVGVASTNYLDYSFSDSYSYTSDKLGRPATVTKTSDAGGTSTILYIYE